MFTWFTRLKQTRRLAAQKDYRRAAWLFFLEVSVGAFLLIFFLLMVKIFLD
ncbi:hypothetical protein [Dawidia soli]|uniref:Uncharacterized protein n=1 Tax=Dawidia soli TaxID=2782352 RepID=A0AAP2DE02_9BACT|nr:hypothetical protein [Dawidia soli]MBT1689998.1 hypothetical protein [Dawidia soli]